MAIFRRKRDSRSRGMPPFLAGLILIALVVLACYVVFAGGNPFSDPYRFSAAFDDAGDVKPKSPVRIAGVDVGKVTKVEPVTKGSGAARVEIEMKKSGLPIHEDATLKVRPRILLEGNKFIDLRPGSPSAPVLEKGDLIPTTQTSAPVQFGDVLNALQSDTRTDLQIFLREFSSSLEEGGAEGFNNSIPYWEPAYKSSAIANEATLGQEPDRDLQRILRGQQRTFAALSEDERALKDLVTKFNVTAAAFARVDDALAASLPALRDTLRVGQPALASLNRSLPSLRAFARDALPGVRSSPETLRASGPFIDQARLLFRRQELRGAARVLRQQIPNLVGLNTSTIPVLEQGRALSRCTNKVLVPFARTGIPEPEFPDNHNQPFYKQAQRGFVGLSGESRLSDANNSFFHGSVVPPPEQSGTQIRPAPPPDGGSQPPPHRPDLPCENQEPPDLNAPSGRISDFPGPSGQANEAAQARALRKAFEEIKELEKTQDIKQARRDRAWREEQRR
jgi:phospholipid/cholesterol/gamma-HCH transport system substrate-binding protein